MANGKFIAVEDLYALKPTAIWQQFKGEHFSFWAICAYLFFEYVRPQSIYPAINILPWAQLFIGFSFIFALMDKSVKWVKNPTNKWMFFFAVCILLATATAFFPEISRFNLINFFQWFVIYFLIINIVNTKRRFYIFLLIFLVATFKISFSEARVWAFRGFAFTSWGLMGPPGYFENSGELAIQMLVFLPISYYFLQSIKSNLPKIKLGIVTLMPITAAMTVLGASSRGAQVGLVYQIYHLFLKGRLSFKNILVVAIIAAAVYAAIPEQQKQRFSNSGHDNTSAQRLLYWKHGIEMIKEYPLLGVGYFNFAPYYERHFPGDMPGEHSELPHNIFIQVGTDAGLLGLFGFSLLLYRGFKMCSEIRKDANELVEDKEFFINISKGLAAALWGFIIAGQFVTVTYYPFLWINLSLTVVLRNVLQKELFSLGLQKGVRKGIR